jgi:hypothetical protein
LCDGADFLHEVSNTTKFLADTGQK